MKVNQPDRRQWLTTTALGAGAALGCSAAQSKEKETGPFGFALNTSTIRQKNLDLVKMIEIAAKAGYQGIEPWIREITDYKKSGGSLKDLAKRLKDLNLQVVSAIGFAQWIAEDEGQRKKGLEQAKVDMDLVRQIGGLRIAAPPTGGTRAAIDLRKAAERYRELLDLGEKMEVVPQVEVWGFSKTLSRLGEAAFVAIESGHPQACILPDIFHLYKGGNAFHGLKFLDGKAMHVFHVNDYPAEPPREKINDAARVYVGDGIAPTKEIFRTLNEIGFRGMLSLELFNRDYWKQDPEKVARTGLEKMKKTVEKSLAG